VTTGRPARPELLSPAALHAFVTVADHGSFTAAAASSGYTQSAVSRQITGLEELCGVPLFVRGPRGVRPTAAGELLLPQARAVLERLTRAAETLEAVRRLEAGGLRVGAFATANAALLPRALAGFRAAHPGVSVTLSEATSERLLPLLESGEIDIAVLSDHKQPPPERLRGAAPVRLLEDPLLAALPAGHPLAARPRVALADLAGEPWIVGGTPEALDALNTLCAGAGFTPRTPLRVDEWVAKLGLVEAGLGVTLLPGLALGTVPAGVSVLPIAPDPPRRTVFAALSEQARSAPLAQALLDHLRCAASPLPGGGGGA
jgi:DNA-binding transcriptional LysR family regulator